MKTNKKYSQGFTLLELLIVIAILAILSAALVLVLNPAESMKKSRDTQRMSDLATLKTALGLYLTTVSSPNLAKDGLLGVNERCLIGGSTPSIYYSNTFTDTAVATVSGANIIKSTVTSTNGDGWLPVNFDGIAGGTPISNLPLDPSNTPTNNTSTTDIITNDALLYRYACDKTNTAFEINAKLESAAFTSDDNKAAKDGGNNSNLYEVGTRTDILPSTNDF